MKRLKSTYPEKAETLPEEVHPPLADYLEREGYFADSRSSEVKRRLNDCAKDILYLIDIFSDDKAVNPPKADYKQLKRLFNEQCEVAREKERVTKSS